MATIASYKQRCFTIGLTLAIMVSYSMAVRSSQQPEGMAQVRVERVLEHKDAMVIGVSSDGSEMILWETDTPVLTARIPPHGRGSVSSMGPSNLIRVEVATGRVTGRIPIGWMPRLVHFYPGDAKVIIRHSPGGLGTFETLVWDLSEGPRTLCEDSDPGSVGDLTPISDEEMIARRSGTKVAREVVRINARNCAVTESFPADPENDQARFGAETLQVSPDKRIVAYSVRYLPRGPHLLLLRNLSDMSVLHRLEVPEEGWQFWGDFTFTNDSDQVIARVSKGFVDQRSRFVIYDVASGRLLREFATEFSRKVAVSPDSTLLATSQVKQQEATSWGGLRKRREKQISIVIYNLPSGEELTRLEFPWTEDTLAEDLTYLGFTGDGQYLLTSTRHTQVWRISRTVQ